MPQTPHVLGQARLAFDPPGAQPREVTRTKKLTPRRTKQATELASVDEPPVVARLVVEIRSDGSRTIARGALEDGQLGERTSLKVEGATPSQLALSLVKALFQAPAFARSVARALLPERTKDATSYDDAQVHAAARGPGAARQRVPRSGRPPTSGTTP